MSLFCLDIVYNDELYKVRYSASEDILPQNWCTGTPYPVDYENFKDLCEGPKTADVLKYGNITSSSDPGPSVDVAVAYLEHRLRRDAPFVYEEYYPLSRLRGLLDLRDENTWGPDIIFKAFDDLDQVIFGGKLRHHCVLSWLSEASLMQERPDLVAQFQKVICVLCPSIAHDDSSADGARRHLRVVEFNLNATRVFLREPVPDLSPWDMMWAGLLEGMVRAYLHISVGNRMPNDPLEDINMGQYIQRCLLAVSMFTHKHLQMQATTHMRAREQIKKDVDAEAAAEILTIMAAGQ